MMRLPDEVDTPHDLLQAFHAFLDRHPVADDELMVNPRLLHNPAWLRYHRVTAAFLEQHPALPALLAGAPHFFRWRQVQRALRPTAVRDELTALDDFIERHAEHFPELEGDPLLLDDPSYVGQHPVLQNFLRDHRQWTHTGAAPEALPAAW